MSTEQRGYIDFLAGGDDGTDTVGAIQPVSDGEPGNANTFRRPSENLRSRTTIVQTAARDMLYYRDAGSPVIEAATGSTVTWPGSTDHAASGKITQVGDLTIRPMLTPKASTKGARTVGGLGVNEVTYTVQPTGYASMGLDEVTVEHRNTGAALLTATISAGPVKHILVEFDSANPAHDAPTAVAAANAAIGAELRLNTFLIASTTAGAGTAITVLAPARIEGTADQEAHRLPSGLLDSFTGVPGNELADGDGIAIWYRYVVEPGFPPAPTPGGRWESNPDRASSTVLIASLFKTTTSPENIPGAVPVCKVVNNILVWCDGSRTAPGTTGPVGAVSAAIVTVDVTSFHGPPTNVVNGGIDTALAPATVQEALESVDVRLGQLRTAWVCTDGTVTQDGHFNGVSAIQNAISTLGAVGGTLLVRRGTYVIPNAYAFPAGVVIITDGLVVIGQAAPISLHIGSQCEFRGVVTFLVGSVEITTGTNVVMERVDIAGRLQVSAGFIGRRVTVNGAASPANYTVRMTGSYSTIDTLVITSHSLDISGDHNSVRMLAIGNTPAALGTSVVRFTGTDCRIDTFDLAATTNITAATALLEIGGTNNGVSQIFWDTSASPITAGRYGVWLNSSINAELRNVHVNMGSGVPLNISGLVTVSGENCFFASTSGSETVVRTSAITGGAQRWSWKQCRFSQNFNTASFMLSLTAPNTSSIHFDTCVFTCSKLSGRALRAEYAQFTDCRFMINNPVVAGAPRLGGDADGQLESLLQFRAGCYLENCTIDTNNSEVNNLAGRPDFTAPLFCEIQAATAVNLSIIGINRQMYSTQEYSSLVDLRENARLLGLTTQFTFTGSVQGGLQLLHSAVTFNVGHIHFTDYTIEAGAPWPGTAAVRYPCAVGAESVATVPYVCVDRVRVLDFFAGICHTDVAALRRLEHSSFVDCVFGVAGVSGSTAAVGIPLPEGRDLTFTRCYFTHIGGVGAGLFTVSLGVGPEYKLTGCYAIANAPEDATVGIFHGVGGGAGMNIWALVGNTFITDATGAFTKPFYTGVGAPENALINVGAGNTHRYNSGAGTTPPTFSANINDW